MFLRLKLTFQLVSLCYFNLCIGHYFCFYGQKRNIIIAQLKSFCVLTVFRYICILIHTTIMIVFAGYATARFFGYVKRLNDRVIS